MNFKNLLAKYRKYSFSERDKGYRFEKLMKAYLLTDPYYANQLNDVWLWEDFFGRLDLGGIDTGIDLVAKTKWGDFWAIQCKCYQQDTQISKKDLDSFIATSSKTFKNEQLKTVEFSHRLWIDTTGKPFGTNAEKAVQNLSISFNRITLAKLKEAPVNWQNLEDGITGENALTEKYTLRPHQQKALDNTNEYFKTAERGKLIMACGTGKTFTSLRIAEKETNNKGLILFLVPSIALLGQTLREWSAQAIHLINAICICSDSAISKGKKTTTDISTVDLALPASTNVDNIIRQFRHIKEFGSDGMTIVFSTYQSIEVIAKAQKALKATNELKAEFDLIICDEAHRTTGVALSKADESAFTKVHDNNFIQAKKRLYMTATPRLYREDAKSKAAQENVILCSMDDEDLYGKEMYRIGFGEAVENGMLTDYKVLILTLNDADVPPSIQRMISNENEEISSDDASKLIGCINALSKQILGDEGIIAKTDPLPMKKAVAFCPKITASKTITNIFNETSDVYIDSLPPEKKQQMVSISSKHIDGTMSAPARDELLTWLKDDSEECRILTNVRCLSEGVDVPSLDAVMFLSARNSEVDVVQSVGRVMRKSPGKKYGYIIIPVVVPSDVSAEKALGNNDRYKVVWTVLNALRAHDDRFNATINKIDLNKKKPNSILIGGTFTGFDNDGKPISKEESDTKGLGNQMAIQFEELQGVMYARMVKKVGDRLYWENWAKKVAEIAENQLDRLKNIIEKEGEHKRAFKDFLNGLQKNINPSITQQQALEMLSQHIITKPVFEALFEGYSFVQNNPVSKSMQTMLNLLEEQAFGKDLQPLEKFYDQVRKKADGIDNAESKQRIIIELYDKFFKTAFPKMVEQLGIVYTPVEVVDFIIYSVNDILIKEFGRSVSDKNIHLLDPFSGTGTFSTRLLQSGLIKQADLLRKYQQEIHANEIVLLAYYISAVNIENTFHDIFNETQDETAEKQYLPFNGICLTDTFQIGEREHNDKLFSEMFPQNSERVQAQKNAPLRVIFGNPPYSIGQKNANDNAQNQAYTNLDKRIAETYAEASKAGLNMSLYDAYIKAFRWSTDKLADEGGIIAFVSNGAWLDGNSTDGFRIYLEQEFSSIYVFNLRGNQRTSGELSRKEGGKIFGSGSRTPISITFLVKNPNTTNTKATIYYHDIGDYLKREEKLQIVREFKSIANPAMQLKTLQPNKEGDWINQRNEAFDTFIPLEPTKKFDLKSLTFFITNSTGSATGRDIWVYSFSKKELSKKIDSLIQNYNSILFQNEIENYDDSYISWTVNLKKRFQLKKQLIFESKSLKQSLYRPFVKNYIYFDKSLIERRGQGEILYKKENLSIIVSGVGSNKYFSALITDLIPDRQCLSNDQYFPLYYYEEKDSVQKGLFDAASAEKYIRRDGVSDFILKRAIAQYGKSVSKEDIFYYVYGILHSPTYRSTFANDLKKMLPRLPLVDEPKKFWAFSKAGRQLADLHINYESVAPHPQAITLYNTIPQAEIDKGIAGEKLKTINYEVAKMRFAKTQIEIDGKTKTVADKSTIVYNSQITISEIPAKAYEYVVNGKPAIEWIMERYQVKTDKKSSITNNPNHWSEEVGKPRYILDLLLSIINVSTQTVDIVEGLPELNFN